MTFIEEIRSLSANYSSRSVEAAEFHADSLREYELAWLDALHGSDEAACFSPTNMARQSRNAWNGSENGDAKLLGIAGPGAVGKDALELRLRDTVPDMRKVVSSTTRPPRPGEVEGVQYHFLEEDAFGAAAASGEFLLVQHREGRGYYGVSRSVLSRTLATTRFASIQESPQNLAALSDAIGARETVTFVAAYLLPPAPVFANLLLRYFTRTLVDGACATDAPVVANMHSTLGLRQIAEFRSAVDIWKQGRPMRFLVNDQLDVAAAAVIDDFFATGVRTSHVA